jgi:hypothetical protein
MCQSTHVAAQRQIEDAKHRGLITEKGKDDTPPGACEEEGTARVECCVLKSGKDSGLGAQDSFLYRLEGYSVIPAGRWPAIRALTQRAQRKHSAKRFVSADTNRQVTWEPKSKKGRREIR